MIVRTTYIDYEEQGGEVVVRVAGRSEDGERVVLHVHGCSPYGYYPEEEQLDPKNHYEFDPDQIDADNVDDLPDAMDELASAEESYITNIEYGYESFDGKPLKKISTKLPKHTNKVKEDFSESYEADLPFYRRVALDGLSGYIEVPDNKRSVNIEDINTEPEYDGEITPRVMIGDIEVLPDMDKTVEESVEQAEEPVVAITLWDSFEDEYCAIVLDEDRQVDAGEVRGHMEDHWGDSQDNDYRDYAQADVTLKRCNSEKALLNEFVRYVEKCRPDIISGWNFCDYDWTYLLNRMMKFDGVNQHDLADVGTTSRPGWNVERAVDGLPAFDMMEGFADKMTFHNWRSKSLDYVSNEEMGMGKVEDADVHTDYNRHRSRFLAYNVVDVELCVELDRLNNIHKFFFDLSDLSSIPVYDTMSEMRVCDGYIISRRDDDQILPTAKETDIERPAGGLVLTPSQGISKNVGVFDLASLYPSCVITCNISPEMMTSIENADVVVPAMPEKESDVGGSITEEDIGWSEESGAIGFSLEQEGLIPEFLKGIFTDRNEAKAQRDQFEPGTPEYNSYDRQQAAIKVIMNSFYGIMTSPYWRLSETGLGDAVTAAGRFTLWNGSKTAVEMGKTVKYGDTDSVMISLSQEEINLETAIDRGEGIESRINNNMDEVAAEMGVEGDHPHLTGDLHGTQTHALDWEFEKYYISFFQAGSKKRYSGLLGWKEGQIIDPPKLDSTGFESARSDTPEIVSEVQPSVIRSVLEEESFESISDYIQSIITDLEERNRPIREFALPGTINKPLEDYPNRETPRACEYGNEYLDRNWSVGGEPFIVYVKSTPIGLPSENVLAIEWNEEVPDGFEVDHEAIIERALHKPLKPIIEEMGWDFDELRSGRRTESLTSGESSSSDPFGGGSSESESKLPW